MIGAAFASCATIWSVELILTDLIESDFRIFTQLREDVFHGGGLGAVVLRDEGTHFRRRGNDDVDLAIEGKAQIFRNLRVERIDERDENGIVGMTHRKRSMKPGQPAGNEMQGVRGAVERVEVHDFGSEGFRNQREELVFGDDAVIDHDVLDRLAGGGGFLREGMALLGIEPAGVDEHVSDLLRIHYLINVRHRSGDDFLRSR